MIWSLTHRADPWSCGMADRHYSRQSIGSPQFVPPGRCTVLKNEAARVLWVTSWPFAEYVKHQWAGAWMNSMFRSEGDHLASALILEAIAATRYIWTPPPLGMVTFVDPRATPGVMVRGERIHGYCYLRAGFSHVGFTQGGLWAWQMLPLEMPPAEPPMGATFDLLARSA